MKKTYLFILIWITLIACQDAPSDFLISGTTEGIQSGTVYLQEFRNKRFYVIDSVQIDEGKFAFSHDLQLPEIYGLTLDTNKNSYMLFLDDHPVRISLDSTRYYSHTRVEGSGMQDLFLEYRKNPDIAIDSFIRENPASLVSAYILYRYYSYRLSPDELENHIALLDEKLHPTQYVQTLKNLIPTLEEVTVGKKAPDFAGQGPDGENLVFSDHLGEGYLLLNFWASWCGPCRRNNPDVVQTYEKYKDKGLQVFGVSLDKNKDGWIRAIENDQLNWPHISDLAMWDSKIAERYGVRVIPSNFLIDPNGVIIAQNLRGEDLDQTLRELLN